MPTPRIFVFEYHPRGETAHWGAPDEGDSVELPDTAEWPDREQSGGSQYHLP